MGGAVNPIEFISAGAGSGKTHRLTQILSEVLENGTCRPHAVLATTFTIKAAASLRERARRRLLANGRLDLATAIGLARIGTVNSICGQLLEQFCFEIGLAPAQDVLAEAEAERLLSLSVEQVFTEDVSRELATLTGRLGFEHDSWAGPIRSVVDAARANDIAPNELTQMGVVNADSLLSSWPTADESCDHTAILISALDNGVMLLQDAIAQGSVVKKTCAALESLLTSRLRLLEDTWSWTTWLDVAKVDPEVKLRSAVAAAVRAAQAHERHPQFHQDIRRYLQLTFELAARALAAFATTKRERGVVDFIDQESLLLTALRDSALVRSVLTDSLDLVLIDEFQDTTPLQLALFVELAKLAKRSVWVGDPKQAIYGFRGTDARLIAEVVGTVESWGGQLGDPLTVSRRSTPALVSLVNTIFSASFSNSMTPEAIQLIPHRQALPAQPSLFDWTFESPRRETDYLGLGRAVANLLQSDLQIEDQHTGQLRRIGPGDVGVLCGRNYDVELAVASLSRHGLAASSARSGLLSTPEALLVLACLRRLHDPADTLATALIVSLSDCARPEEWLADRLAYLKNGGTPHHWRAQDAGAHPLVARIELLRPRLACLSPSEAMRLARSESRVAHHASKWSATAQDALARIANVEALVAMAIAYEDAGASAKRPATLAGLLIWLDEQAANHQDLRAASAADAIEVMTHHRAKGLEWPVTIVSGLGHKSRSALWGVRARTHGIFDPNKPLARRMVHYWPNPYGRHKKPQAATAAEGSFVGLQMATEALEESKRLLYVSFTRARDALVLLSFKKQNRQPARGWIDEVSVNPYLFGPSGVLTLPDGVAIQRSSLEYTVDQCAELSPTAAGTDQWWYTSGEPLPSIPLWLQPSNAEGGTFATDMLERVGKRIALTAAGDLTALGSAIHNCIALAFSDRDKGLSVAEAKAILTRWDVELMVDSVAVVEQVAAFTQWITARWGTANVMVEIPIEANLANGRRLRGQIDLLVDAPTGWILIDHKCDPRSAAGDDRLANAHGPQLAAYAAAVHTVTGRPVLEQWVFLPVAAQAVRLVELSAHASDADQVEQAIA
jgi:ATP-dependent exoDNAse (exonuclease V) beta subunit